MKRYLSLLAVAVILAGCGGTTPAPNPGTDPTDPEPPPVPETEACANLPETLPSLEVPTGTVCLLSGTVIQGDVTVAAGATIDFFSVQVGGSVRSEGATAVTVQGGEVAGDVLLSGGGAVDANVWNVAGNVQLLGNSGLIGVSESTVGGNLEVLRNTGSVFIGDSTVGGDLICEGNGLAPEGGENQVAGSRSGQCAAL